MLYFVAACIAFSVALTVLFVMQISPRRTAVVRRLDELEQDRYEGFEQFGRRRRMEQSERLKEILQLWGEKVEQTRPDNETVRLFLTQAGYMGPNSVAYYWGTRLLLAAGLGSVGVLLGPCSASRRSSAPWSPCGWAASAGSFRRSTCGIGSSTGRRQ